MALVARTLLERLLEALHRLAETGRGGGDPQHAARGARRHDARAVDLEHPRGAGASWRRMSPTVKSPVTVAAKSSRTAASASRVHRRPVDARVRGRVPGVPAAPRSRWWRWRRAAVTGTLPRSRSAGRRRRTRRAPAAPTDRRGRSQPGACRGTRRPAASPGWSRERGTAIGATRSSWEPRAAGQVGRTTTTRAVVVDVSGGAPGCCPGPDGVERGVYLRCGPYRGGGHAVDAGPGRRQGLQAAPARSARPQTSHRP